MSNNIEEEDELNTDKHTDINTDIDIKNNLDYTTNSNNNNTNNANNTNIHTNTTTTTPTPTPTKPTTTEFQNMKISNNTYSISINSTTNSLSFNNTIYSLLPTNLTNNTNTKYDISNVPNILLTIFLTLFRYFTPYILVCLSFYYYLLSQVGCNLDTDLDRCELDFQFEMLLKIIYYVFLTSLSISSYIILQFYIEVNFSLALFISNMVFICFFSNGKNLYDHSFYNLILLFVLVIVELVVFYVVIKLYNTIYSIIFEKISITKLVILFFSSFILYILLYNYVFVYSCKDWEVGFTDFNKHEYGDQTKINTNTYLQTSNTFYSTSCKIRKPYYCSQHILSNIFDISFLLNENCTTNPRDSTKYLMPFITENTKHKNNIYAVGYPYATVLSNISLVFNVYGSVIREFRRDMEDLNVNKNYIKQIEASVYFNPKDNKGKVKINLKYNENEAIKRKEVFKDKAHQYTMKTGMSNDPRPNNIFLFYIDSVSRVLFKRKMPLTFGLIEKYYKYNSSSNNKNNKEINNHYNIQSFQFLKYHSGGPFTHYNMGPVLYDHITDNPISRLPDLFTTFKDNGYITGVSTDYCQSKIVTMETNENSTHYSEEMADHDFSSIFCDENFSYSRNEHSFFKGHYSPRIKCLYGKQTGEHSLEYTKQFFDKYKDSPKFFSLGFIYNHDNTGEPIKYMDKPVYETLKYLFENHLQKNSVFYFMSDHNFIMPSIYSYFKLDDWVQEWTLPFLYVIMSKDVDKFYEKAQILNANEYNMIVPYDIHRSLFMSIDPFINNIREFKGRDIFKDRIKDNTCQAFAIKKEYCRCSEEEY